MSDFRSSTDVEMDFLDFLEILWRAKWTLILTTSIAIIIGFIIANASPVSFNVSAPIGRSGDSAFIELIPLNSIVNLSAEKKLSIERPSANAKNGGEGEYSSFPYDIFNPKYFFETFVKEFNDHEEILTVLKENAAASRNADGVVGDALDAQLLSLANKFKITPPSKVGGEWTASFEWHDVAEGKKLFKAAMLIALDRTRALMLNEVSKLSESIDEVNARILEDLEADLGLLLDSAAMSRERKLQGLRMHSAIAKDLGIANYQLTAVGAVPDAAAGIAATIEGPLYLRGFKALDKEISLVEALTNDQLLITQPEYQEKSDRIRQIKSDTKSALIRTLVEEAKTFDTSDWVQFDFSGSSVRDKSNAAWIRVLSAVFGLLIGLAYVIALNEIRKRKHLRGPVVETAAA